MIFLLAACITCVDCLLSWAFGQRCYAFRSDIMPALRIGFALIDLVLIVSIILLLMILQGGGRVSLILGGLFNIVFSVFYSTSWFLKLIQGRFLDVESLRYFTNNPWLIMLHVIPKNLDLILMNLIVSICIAVILMKIIKITIKKTNRKTAKYRLAFCCLLTLVFICSIYYLVNIPAFKKQVVVLRQDVSPQITIVTDMFKKPAFLKTSSGTLLNVEWHKQALAESYIDDQKAAIVKAPVIILVIESLRSDVLRDGDSMPNLFALVQDSLNFNEAFTTSSQSDYAGPSILSSQYPLRSKTRNPYSKDVAYPHVLIYDILKDLGYKTAIFSAQNENWCGMRNFYNMKNLDVFFDASSQWEGKFSGSEDLGILLWSISENEAGKLDDGVVMNGFIDWHEKLDSEDFVVYMNFQRSHFPYTWPENFSAKFFPCEMNFRAVFTSYPRIKAEIMKNRYFNALSYIDLQVGRLIDYLKKKNIYDKSLIIVAGEHGESFYEKGTPTHGFNIYNETAVVPIIFKTPNSQIKGVKRNHISHIDIAPTICHFLGIRPHPAFQGIDVMISPQVDSRPIFLTVNTPRGIQDSVVYQGWKFIKDYETEEEMLFNLNDDFHEASNLVKNRKKTASILSELLDDWRNMQLGYYSDPGIYKSFYPPKIMNIKLSIE
jgi:glucan phosphoethanolaminetransferase (alkaline phosphatase superfamily)